MVDAGDLAKKMGKSQFARDVGTGLLITALIGVGSWGISKLTGTKDKTKQDEQRGGEPQQKNLAVTETVLIRCPKCKAKNKEDARYCKECGKKI